jgi:hypothetical protein
MKASDLSVNERSFYRQMHEATELVVGGYENDVQDGHRAESEAPTLEMIVSEAYGEVGIQIENLHDRQLRFIGKDRMNELATLA